MRRNPWAGMVAGFGVAALVLAGCSGGGDTASGDGSEGSAAGVCDGVIDGATTVKAWVHQGQTAEQEKMTDLVSRFNSGPGAEKGVTVEIEYIPDAAYNATVQSGAVAGDLPDALDFDGPNTYNYAWSGNLVPIDSCVTDEVRNNLLPSIIDQGTYNDQLYSVGYFDSGVGIWAWRSVLEENGIRIPAGPADAWSVDEFSEAMKTLKAAGFKSALASQYYYGGEWYTYGFAPIIQSAGGDLIDRETFQTADGVLNGPESVGAMTTWQQWVKDGLVDIEAVDDLPFQQKEIPLQWVGHWLYTPNKDALGDDLVILPLPDFGKGTVSPSGSWNWGITKNATEPDAVWAWLEFLLSDEVVVEWSGELGNPPATKTGVDKLPVFQPDGDMGIFIEGLKTTAVPRPATPGYPAITLAFQQAFADITQGADVQSTLDKAAATINEDLEANQFYPTQ
jgi:multiple sugar transport system substrate-binding protein